MEQSKNIPAFPNKGSNTPAFPVYDGMTLRDYFAAKALPALIEKLNFSGAYNEQRQGESVYLGSKAYLIADAMIEARGK